MTKTDYLEKAIEDAIPALVESGRLTALEMGILERPVQLVSPAVSMGHATSVKFPTPLASWGTVTHFLIPNPRWRWWCFWRPRMIVFEANECCLINET